jgi:RanBP1 domain
MPGANEVARPPLSPTTPVYNVGVTMSGGLTNSVTTTPVAPAGGTGHYPNLSQPLDSSSMAAVAGPEQLTHSTPQFDVSNPLQLGRDTSNVGPAPDIFVDKQPQSQEISVPTPRVDGFLDTHNTRMELQSAKIGTPALSEGPTMPLGEIPLPNSETETLARNTVFSKWPSESALQIDPITKVQPTNLFSSPGQDNTKNQGTSLPLPTQSLSGAWSGDAESTKPLPRKIAYPGKSFTMSPTRTGRATIPEPPKATIPPNQTTVVTDVSNQHLELSRVLRDVPNIPADFSESQKQLYIMQYRIRSLNVAFKEATSALNLASAADWKPWIQLRDDICEKILEAGSRTLERKPDETLGDNGKRAHTGAEQVKRTSQTASMFGSILKQGLEAKEDSERIAQKPSEPIKSTDIVSSALQSNASTTVPSAPPVLKPPTFGAPGNFMSQFAKAAEETAKKDKEKRKAEEFDSDEEDEEEWERRDAEAQLAKKKKIEEESENKRSTFVPGEGFSLVSTPAKPVGIFNALTPTAKTSKGGLFDRISVGKDGKPMRVLPTDVEQSAKTPPASDKSIFASEGNGINAFGFTINPSSDGERSTKSSSTGGMPIPAGESNDTDGVNAFGFKINPPSDREELTSSAGSTPIPSSHMSPFSTNPFVFSSNPPSDGEKSTKSPSANQPPTFGESSGTNAFGFKFNPPDIAKSTKPPSTSQMPTFGGGSGTNTFSFNFNPTSDGEKPAKSPSASYVFGGDGSADPVTFASSVFQTGGLLGVKPTPKSVMSLSVPVAATPSNTSRATTPGATTDAGDSASESTAEGQTPKGEDDLGYTFAGESDEDVIFQVKARPYEFVRKTGQYERHGAGRFRVLKHRVTGKTRMVHRTAPQWDVFLNAALLPAARYETTADNAVRIITASEDGALTQWKMKVLKKEDATELARILNENRPVELTRTPEEKSSSTEPARLPKEGEAITAI